MAGQLASEFRKSAPFNIEQSATQHTGPQLLLSILIQVSGEQVTMAFQLFSPPQDALGAMKPVEATDALGIGLSVLVESAIQNNRPGNPLG